MDELEHIWLEQESTIEAAEQLREHFSRSRQLENPDRVLQSRQQSAGCRRRASSVPARNRARLRREDASVEHEQQHPDDMEYDHQPGQNGEQQQQADLQAAAEPAGPGGQKA